MSVNKKTKASIFFAMTHCGYLKFLFSVLLLFSLSFCFLQAENPETKSKEKAKRILLIFPYNLSFAQQYSMSSRFFDSLSQTGISYRLTQLELDTLQIPDLKHWQAQFQHFLPDIKAGKYDLIVTFGANALEILRKNFASLPPDTPIVFCGQAFFDAQIIKEHNNMTGIIHQLDPVDNINLAKTLFPDVKRIILLTNWTVEGEHIRRLAVENFQQRTDGLELVLLDNKKHSTIEMLDRISRIGNSVVLFYGWYNKDAVNFSSLQTLMTHLENNKERPLLVMHDVMMRYGVIGGVMARAGQTGEMTAALAARILRGEKANDIPVMIQQDEIVLNWSQIQYHKIPDNLIPSDADILGKPKNFWKLYKNHLVFFGVFLLVVYLFLNVILILYLRHRRLATENRRLAEYEVQVNSWLESIENGENDDAVLPEIIAKLIQILNAENAHIFRLNCDKRIFHLTKKWKIGLPSQEQLSAEGELDTDAAWYRRLSEHELLHIEGLSDPDSAKESFSPVLLLNGENLSDIYILGIWYDGNLWGCLALEFASSHKDLSDYAEKLLKTTVHITEIVLARKKNKALLEFSRYEKQLILDTIKIPILLFDHDCKLLRRNKAAYDLLKDAEMKNEAPPCCAAGFCKGKECPESCPVRQTYLDQKIHKDIRQFNGKEFQFSAYPIFIGNKISYILTTLVDITELSENQRRLAEALQDAQNAAKAKSFFISSMNHELRTPLNAVIGFSELLQTTEMPRTEQNEYLDLINQAGNTLLSLISDMIELSKLESGDFIQSPQPANVSELLKGELKFFEQKAKERQLELDFLELTPLPVLELDALRLKKIVFNLIANAMKFTIQGYIKLSVGFTETSPDRGTLEIHVEDTGIGIRNENREQIFEPFTRQDKSETGAGARSLALSKRIAEKIGGTILLSSEYGKGSTFSLKLENVKIAPDTKMSDAQ